ncbi:MAG: hypothetical protein HYZ81_11470 [Nitrospinae bacterium]|nr:hypothetical protein [Nitrospinota bacterium]
MAPLLFFSFFCGFGCIAGPSGDAQPVADLSEWNASLTAATLAKAFYHGQKIRMATQGPRFHV